MSVGQARVAIRLLAARQRLRIWAVLAVALGVGLGWVPLFGVLGFELATAAALFAAVMGLDAGSALARELQRAAARADAAARCAADGDAGAGAAYAGGRCCARRWRPRESRSPWRWCRR